MCFQTGSGTSTNMNANEVIATLASRDSGLKIHPTTTLTTASRATMYSRSDSRRAALEIQENLLPSLRHLNATLRTRADELDDVIKTDAPLDGRHAGASWDRKSAAGLRKSSTRLSASKAPCRDCWNSHRWHGCGHRHQRAPGTGASPGEPVERTD
jgi:fumarate hydratase class II